MNEHQKRSVYTLCALISALVVLPVFAIYFPMLGHDPLLDDPVQIRYIQGLDSVWDCFKPDSNNWFRPFKNFVFYLTYSEESGTKWTSAACLSIFVLNTYLVGLLLFYIFDNRNWSLVGTALFAYNPTMVSSVQFLSACNNQISLSFICVTLILSLVYARSTIDLDSKRPARLVFAGVLLSLMLSMVAYEAALPALGMVVVIIWAKYGGRYLVSRAGIQLWGGGLFVVAAYLLIRMDAAKMDFVSPSLPHGVTRIELILRAPYYALTHFLLWVEPWGRGGVFLDDDPRGKLILGVISWIILLLVSGVLLRLLNTRFRFLAAGLLIFLGGMTTLANFLGLGNGPICNYYLLIPGIGLVIAYVALFKELGKLTHSKLKGGLLLVLGLLLMCLAWNSRERVLAWRNQLALIDFTVENYPDNYHGLSLQAERAIAEGKYDEAQGLLFRARDIAPWAMPGYLYSAYAYRLDGENLAAQGVLESYEQMNGRTTWSITERLAELALQRRDWQNVDYLMNKLLSTEPHPLDHCRFYVQVVIPYFIVQGRLEEARYLVQELEGMCSTSDYDQWEKLQQHREFLSRH
ncbi:tetratricopeptide repeat protein [Cerasicoccus maritimus]|uniref:tetratricopeptide repeat protein n=1 Tax=Cerasicoccus maritimus TaxID=490089 RepID=UPI0028526838|nr:hypothetical protein [Cerasicoccus maritimus]